MKNNFYLTTASNLIMSHCSINDSRTYDDKVRVLFEYFFSTQDSLKDQNKTLFIFLEKNLRDRNYEVVDKLINDDAINELHLSLIKSAIIMTENLSKDLISIEKIISTYNKKS